MMPGRYAKLAMRSLWGPHGRLVTGLALLFLGAVPPTLAAGAVTPAVVEPVVRKFGEHCDLVPPKTREERVVLRMNISAEGKASEVEVVDGFFDKRFASEALQCAQSAVYAPATRDGVPEPFESYVYVIVSRLGERGERVVGITPQFRRELAKAVDLIKSGHPHEAHLQVESMLADSVTLLYEVAVLEAMLAETQQGVGDLPEALYNSRKASEPAVVASTPYAFELGATPPPNREKRYVLTDPLLSLTLRRRVMLDIKLGHVPDALQAYWELAGLKALPAEDPILALIPQLEQRLRDPAPLEASARIRQDGFWNHSPYRRAFTVADVTGGKLTRISVGCGKYHRALAYQPGVDWQLPESYQRCRVSFEGDVGTAFKIIEADVPAGAAAREAADPATAAQ